MSGVVAAVFAWLLPQPAQRNPTRTRTHIHATAPIRFMPRPPECSGVCCLSVGMRFFAPTGAYSFGCQPLNMRDQRPAFFGSDFDRYLPGSSSNFFLHISAQK